LSAPDGAETPRGADSPAGGDTLGVVAVALGCLGIVVAGILLAVVTAVVATAAGQRARDAGRSMENAYIAFGLAALDGVVWIVLHLFFDLAFIAG
jgi:hypothetical protein